MNKMKEAFLLILGILLVFSGCGKKSQVYLEESQAAEPVTEEVSGVSVDASTEIMENPSVDSAVCYVYVCGEVANPGVYILPEGSRIYDAMEQAGGLTESASPSYWNQAELLSDGQMLYVPSVEEVETGELLNQPEQSPGSGNENNGTSADGRIDLNSASKEQLMTIPGVGEAKAESILAYRQEHGAFSKVEDVMNITGIKEGLYAKMKDYITIN